MLSLTDRERKVMLPLRDREGIVMLPLRDREGIVMLSLMARDRFEMKFFSLCILNQGQIQHFIAGVVEKFGKKMILKNLENILKNLDIFLKNLENLKIIAKILLDMF